MALETHEPFVRETFGSTAVLDLISALQVMRYAADQLLGTAQFLCCAVLRCAVLRYSCAVLCCAVLCCAILVLCCAMLRFFVPCYLFAGRAR